MAWGEILSVSNENPITAEGQLSNLLSKCHELFTDSYEGMNGLEVHITMKSNVKPIGTLSKDHERRGRGRTGSNFERKHVSTPVRFCPR